MNRNLKSIDEESVLFFDIEDVRKSKELDINSREFELFREKTRNRETDEYLTNEEVILEYQKKAALKIGYTKIVTIGVGFIKDGEVHIKSLEGEEHKVIEDFCKIAQSFSFVCGVNITAFDLPMIVNNGCKYFDVCEVLPDRFITSGKKPWELKSVVDLMEVFKGTHYSNSSLDEMCYHFGLPSPKTDLKGSQVSDEYWENGLEKISKYVKEDVFAVVNLFKRMRFEKVFNSFIDKNSDEVVEDGNLPLLKRLYQSKIFSKDIQNELKGLKINVEDKETVKKFVLAHYLEKIEVTAKNKGQLEEINKKRTEEIEKFFKKL